MAEDDIHTIWRIFGPGGLIDKLGPDRTIRELKKRCDAGAVIGCSLYKLLIEKWIDVATGAKDKGQRGPAEEFMQSAGEDELVKNIEALHEQYPDGIPRSIRMDIKDQWNEELERKLGRRIPLDPKDASKKDIEDSKKIAEQLAAGVGLPRLVKPKIEPPEKEKLPPEPVKPAERSIERPPPREPAEVPSTPLIIKGTPELELMKKEIEAKIAEERRRRARGGGMAGEQKVNYAENEKKRDYNDGREQAKFCFEYVLKTGNICPTALEYGAIVGAVADIIRNKKQITQDKIDDLTTTIFRLHQGSEFYRGVYDYLIEKIKEYRKGEPAITGKVREGDEKNRSYLINDNEVKKFIENANGNNDDVMQEPIDYSKWMFADFEGLISGLTDPEDLEELYEYIDASDKITETDAENLRKMIQDRIKEVEKTGS